MVVNFLTSRLSLLFALLLLSRRGWQKPLFYRFFVCHPLSYNLVLTSANNHHNRKLKKGMATIPFWKACFQPKHQKMTKLWTPLWKPWGQKWTNISETAILILVSAADHVLTLKCGPLIDPENPQMWTTYWPYSMYVYIYIYICMPWR